MHDINMNALTLHGLLIALTPLRMLAVSLLIGAQVSSLAQLFVMTLLLVWHSCLS